MRGMGACHGVHVITGYQRVIVRCLAMRVRLSPKGQQLHTPTQGFWFRRILDNIDPVLFETCFLHSPKQIAFDVLELSTFSAQAHVLRRLYGLVVRVAVILL